jgi:hypothetical protein
VVRQIERGVVFRLGRALPGRGSRGLTALIPFVDKTTKVSMQIVTLPVPAQESITRDNVSVKVDAVVYFPQPREQSYVVLDVLRGRTRHDALVRTHPRGTVAGEGGSRCTNWPAVARPTPRVRAHGPVCCYSDVSGAPVKKIDASAHIGDSCIAPDPPFGQQDGLHVA